MVIKVFEAFSGYGSQSMALKKYGIKFKTVGISEIDKYAIKAHEAVHGQVKNYGDISRINTLSLPDHDLCTYSFPCQDISLIGDREGFKEGSKTKSSLLWECQKIIEMKRPKYLMMENVKNLVGKKNKPDFDRWLEVLETLGYNNYWKVINAKNCGIPQNRERVFCVSILKEHDNNKFKFYDDLDSNVKLKDILEDQIDKKYYLSGTYLNWWEKNKEYQLKKGFSALNRDIAICLTARQYASWNGNYIDNGDGIRKLTPKECFRLMGVSDIDINKIQDSGISDSQQYKMAGNSIVVNCMKFLEQLK